MSNALSAERALAAAADRRAAELLSADGKFILQAELQRTLRDLAGRFGRNAVVAVLADAGFADAV